MGHSSYKSFSLNLSFDYRIQKGRNAFAGMLPAGIPGTLSNIPAEIFNNRWKQPGDNALYARFSTQTPPATSVWSDDQRINTNIYRCFFSAIQEYQPFVQLTRKVVAKNRNEKWFSEHQYQQPFYHHPVQRYRSGNSNLWLDATIENGYSRLFC